MKQPNHRDAKDLIHNLLLPFYLVERDMLVPIQSPGRRRNENDAEHSWSVAVLACSLAQHIDSNLDVGLVAQFALVHDLVELYAGDTSVWASDILLKSKESSEAVALKRLKGDFKNFPWLISTVEKYEKQDSNEALFVRAIDKYIALCVRFMDDGEYFIRSKITKKIFDKNMTVHREKAHGHKGAAKYYEKIREEYEAHPEHFYSEKLILLIAIQPSLILLKLETGHGCKFFFESSLEFKPLVVYYPIKLSYFGFARNVFAQPRHSYPTLGFVVA